MTTHYDPAQLLKDTEAAQGPISPPGGVEGIVIIRRRKGIRAVFGIGRVGGTFQLSRAQGRATSTPVMRELTTEEYDELRGVLSRPKFKQIGAVLAANTVGGEDYFIKYLQPPETAVSYLADPRKCDLSSAVELADLIDVLLENRRWRAATAKTSDEPPTAGKPLTRRQRRLRTLRFAMSVVAMLSAFAYWRRGTIQLISTKPMPVPNQSQEIHLKADTPKPPRSIIGTPDEE